MTAATVFALEPQPPEPSQRPLPHLPAVRAAQPPKIDGRLDDLVWQSATGSDAFTQQSPYDGAPPSEHTRVKVLYDDDALYVGFDCEQIHTPIVELLTRRDRDSESEWVWVYVDSRNDGKSAFIFAVNVAGVLADGQIIDQTTQAWDWDENWEGKTARTPHGWSVELRIPLRVLRFDGSLPVQSWGFQATRFIADRQEADLWAYFPREVASPVAFLGRLDDLRNLKAGGTLELRPFLLGEVARNDPGPNMAGSGWSPGGSLGLDLRWHLAQDLTLDAAFNPDFAQVEADQVILNLTNFETQLPEKRPFFLEGIDAFSFPLQVFYSRRIGAAPPAPTTPVNAAGDPTEIPAESPAPATIYGAGKIVGRIGPDWTIGAMSALTGTNSLQFVNTTTGQYANRLAAPAAAFNVLRLKRELGGAGHVGLIGTAANRFEGDRTYPTDATGAQLCPSGALAPLGTRCFHDAYVGGADARWRSPSADYVATGAFIQTLVEGGPTQPLPELDGTVIGPGSTGSGGWFRVAKEGGRHLLWSAEYSGASRKLQYNDVGYMARQNLHHGKVALGWRTLDVGAYTLETTSALEVSDNRNLSGLDLGMLYELNTRIRLLNFSTVLLAADFGPSRFDDREVGDGAALELSRYLGGRLELYTDPRGRFTGSLSNQTQILAVGGFATTTQASLLVHALQRLDLELIPLVKWTAGEYRYIRQLASPPDGYYFGKLATKNASATLRATYTFTPQLTLQAYAQAFLASGTFTDSKSITQPAAGGSPVGTKITLANLAAAPRAVFASTDNPDFEDAAINLNLVLRWEYRLGATLYLVYTHSQIPTVPLTEFAPPAGLSPSAFHHGQTSDVVLLKLSYWWAS
jgi:hypothetical protein